MSPGAFRVVWKDMATTENAEPRTPGTEIAAPEELYRRVRASIDETVSPAVSTRARTIIAALLVPCATLGVVALTSYVVYRPPMLGLDVADHSTLEMRISLLLLTGLAIVATVVALRRSRGGAGLLPLFLAACLVAPLHAALILVNPLHAAHPLPSGVEFSPWGARCIALATIVGACVLIAFTAALRRAVPVASGLRGVAVGAAAGAWASLAIFLFCPAGSYLHLVVGHVLPVFALTGVGAVGIPRLLRP
jgi:Negative regulator of sigma F